MEKLPSELLSKIMLYLPPVDRLNSSLTCRRFAKAMTSSQLLDDIWLDIAGHEIEAATPVLVNSQRQYTKLLLYEADLTELNFGFWRRIGASLRVLKLVNCPWSNHVHLYSVLQHCTKLESLTLVDHSRRLSIDNFVLSEEACEEKLRDSLSHLRHLHLGFKVTAEILNLLIGLMPNVTSIFLQSFDEKSDFLERLPSIVKRNRIVRTGINLCATEIGTEDIIKFMEAMSDSLVDLRVGGGDELTESVCEAIVDCIDLRLLSLTYLWTPFNVSHLKKLVSNSPNLTHLGLQDTGLGDEDMMLLAEFKKLRTLCLKTNGTRITNESLCRLSEIPNLVGLDLSESSADSRVLRSLGSLKNLQSLALKTCDDPECLEAICENFERLTELALGWVKNLTDADGMKLRHLKELRILSFYGGKRFTNSTFARGVGSRVMKSLVIHGSPLTDAGLMSIASFHGRLEKLGLRYCHNLTDAGIMALLQNEPRLKELDVSGSPYVQPEMLTELRDLCPRLRVWSIY